MNADWMDANFVLDYYQESVIILVWLLASFTCFWVFASMILLYLECHPLRGLSPRRRKEILHQPEFRSSVL